MKKFNTARKLVGQYFVLRSLDDRNKYTSNILSFVSGTIKSTHLITARWKLGEIAPRIVKINNGRYLSRFPKELEHERRKRGKNGRGWDELRLDGATQKVICSMLERAGGIVRSQKVRRNERKKERRDGKRGENEKLQRERWDSMRK